MKIRTIYSEVLTKINVFYSKHSKIILLIPVLYLCVYIGYNEYLDYKSVEDAKKLLFSFQKIKTEVEGITNENFKIRTDCGHYGEKFATTLSCNLVLLLEDPENIDPKTFEQAFLVSSMHIKGCEISRWGSYEGYGYCPVLNIRPSTEDRIEVFLKRY